MVPLAQPGGFEPDGGQDLVDGWREPVDDVEPSPDGLQLPKFEGVAGGRDGSEPARRVEPGPDGLQLPKFEGVAGGRDGSEPARRVEPGPDGGGDAAAGGAGDPGGPFDEVPVDLPGLLRVEDYGERLDLGFSDWPDRYELDWHKDEVAVRRDSVLVRGGVVRGLVQNMSDRLFARGVTVSVGEWRWVFPLTVQPTEVVPFVIEGFEGPSDPALISFEVAVEFVPEPDPRRSFEISGLPGPWGDEWGQVQHDLPGFLGETPPEGTSDEDWVNYYETGVELYVPTSHPSIAGDVRSLMIDDLRVYLTKMDADDRVIDVREMVPYQPIEVGLSEDGLTRWGHTPIDRLPANGLAGFQIGFLLLDDAGFALTVGGAHVDDVGRVGGDGG